MKNFNHGGLGKRSSNKWNPTISSIFARRVLALADESDKSRVAAETMLHSTTLKNNRSDKISIYQKYPNYNFVSTAIIIFFQMVILKSIKLIIQNEVQI
tara:strand:+ start:484 stop:780 length:297 start_codon:yes stop_codon:yes gene_type:complete